MTTLPGPADPLPAVVELAQPRWRSIVTGLGSLLLTAGSLLVALAPMPAALVGWFGVVFFGFGAFWFAGRVVRRVTALRLDRDGLVDRTTAGPPTVLAWPDVVAVHALRFGNQPMVGVDVETGVMARLPAIRRWSGRANQRLSGFPINIVTRTVGVDPAELAVVMERFRRESA